MRFFDLATGIVKVTHELKSFDQRVAYWLNEKAMAPILMTGKICRHNNKK